MVRAERWNKEAPEADREYFEIQREALQLPEGLRGEITKPLKEKRADSITPDDTLTDYTRNHLTRLFDRGMMGKFKVPGVGLAERNLLSGIGDREGGVGHGEVGWVGV